jgi:uncharacterized protein
MTAIPIIPVATARRLLLGAQGLLDKPGGRVTADRLYDLIERMGFVQIDSINVIERAHHLTLFARLHGYRPKMLERLLQRDRRLFEHWTHDASAIPTVWYPHWRFRFERYRQKMLEKPWWQERVGPEPEKIIAEVRARLARRGPVMARDFDDIRDDSTDRAWWAWKPEKAALEYLWRTGEVAISGRANFQKMYDLAERVLPEAHAAPQPDPEEHVDWACRTALERLGVASPDEIAGFWSSVPLEDVKAWCARAKDIVAVQVEAVDGSARDAFAVADWEERAAALPRAPNRIRLLSPFDPVLRDRERCRRLFGFDYRFEAFVPEPQRHYGYYVLPVLEGERLIGRLDAKYYRDRRVLDVRKLWLEAPYWASKGRQKKLESALDRLTKFVGAEKFRLLYRPSPPPSA